MSDLHNDIHYLLRTAREAIGVLRRNVEYFEVHGKDANAEREAARWLSLAVHLVQHDLQELHDADDEAVPTPDNRELLRL